MRIRFLAPRGRVTGSCHWLRDSSLDVEFLVDPGLMQGEGDFQTWNERPLPFDPRRIDFVLLTHAHMDHVGMLPRLAREGFNGPIWCTPETAEIAQIMLRDAARHTDLFRLADVDRLKFKSFPDRQFDFPHPVHRDVFVAFYRAAHILGAVSIQVIWGRPPFGSQPGNQRRITFSGDLGPNEEGFEHLPFHRRRMDPRPADYAVVESTYGNVIRPADEQDDEARLARLGTALDEVVAERGVLILPCFAVDRTQAILFDLMRLQRRHPEGIGRVPVYLHAPTAAKVSQVYARGLKRKEKYRAGLRPLWLGRGTYRTFGLDPETREDEATVEATIELLLTDGRCTQKAPPDAGVGAPSRVEPSTAVFRRVDTPVSALLGDDAPEPCVLVTGGGMCEGGPVLAYLDPLLRRSNTTLLFPGYVGGGTVGSKLLRFGGLTLEERGRLPDEVRWIDDRKGGNECVLPVAAIQARIRRLPGYSSHADAPSLLRWLFCEYGGKRWVAGRTVFVTHGSENARRALADAIGHHAAAINEAVSVVLPGPEQGWYDLDAGGWMQDAAAGTAEQPGGAGLHLVSTEALEAELQRRKAS
jgi:metallo-beta-lactamase family protein